MRYVFGTCTLDTEQYVLDRAGFVVPLQPKVFAVLDYLLNNRDRVIAKQELCEQVWPGQFISDATIEGTIKAIRRAVDDDGRTQWCIRTRRGQGYQFVASISPETPPQVLTTLTSPVIPAPSVALKQENLEYTLRLVGGKAELIHIQTSFSRAARGDRQITFITGEAGIGKTTLVDTFIAQITTKTDVWMGRGQCIEQYGAGEPYLPLLEALGRLGRTPKGKRLIEVFRKQAPSWLVHLPALTTPEESAALQKRIGSTTRDRMLRELAEAIETLTAELPLILVLEDLHWSDRATLEWVAYIARRRDPARLLILCTYRSVEARMDNHPVHTVAQELQQQESCTALVLDYLTEAEVEVYLSHRLGPKPLPIDMARVLHHCTNGNPLFLISVVQELLAQSVLQEAEDEWRIQGGFETLTGFVPESLRHLIERYIDQLPPEDQAILEAGSLAGRQFAIAEVEAGIGQNIDHIDTQCAIWARQGRLLEAAGLETWHDGTVSTCYRFIHAFYREVVSQRVPLGRQVRLHLLIGRRKEVGYGIHARALAAELAMHFVQGHDPHRAVQYLYYAGENALQRSAHLEAITHLNQGLDILQEMPETRDRQEREQLFYLILGPALIATKGYTAREVENVYSRARQLCNQVSSVTHLFRTLWGLWVFYNVKGESQTAQDLGEELLRVACDEGDSQLHLQACHALGNTFFWRGEFSMAQDYLDQGISLYDPEQHGTHALRFGGHDPGVCCMSFAATTLWLRGYPDQALAQSHKALKLARQLEHTNSVAHALSSAVRLSVFRREDQRALSQAEELVTLAKKQGFSAPLAAGLLWGGWALSIQGRGCEGIAQMQKGLALRAGELSILPSYLGALSEVQGKIGRTTEAFTSLAEALQLADNDRGRDYAPELYRLKGTLYLSQSISDVYQAEVCFHEALNVARRQRAKSWELRAAISLSRLWQGQGKRQDAYNLLGVVFGWFTEGLETADLQEAKALLEELA